MVKGAKCSIVEVEEIVEAGEIDPDKVHVPGIYVHRLLKGAKYEKPIEVRRKNNENKIKIFL